MGVFTSFSRKSHASHTFFLFSSKKFPRQLQIIISEIKYSTVLKILFLFCILTYRLGHTYISRRQVRWGSKHTITYYAIIFFNSTTSTRHAFRRDIKKKRDVIMLSFLFFSVHQSGHDSLVIL